MPLTLVRRPRSARVQHKIVLDEVEKAYRRMAEDMINRLLSDISDWENQPEFKYDVHVGPRVWRVIVKFDGRTKEGKIYNWVDKGTAQRGGKGAPYDIYPKKKKALAFDVPHYPKTTAQPIAGLNIPGIVMAQGSQEQEHVVVAAVKGHKGITPRNFTKSLKEEMKQRTRPGAFRSVSEAAIKRGIRRLGKNA